MTDTYKGVFTCWADVQKTFKIDMLEPEEIILAEYDQNYYDGEATVIYRNSDEYGWVEESHCSCYELGGMWKPELYDLGTLVLAIERIIKASSPYSRERIVRLTFVLGILAKRRQEQPQ